MRKRAICYVVGKIKRGIDMNVKQTELIESELEACSEIMHNNWLEQRKKEGKHHPDDCRYKQFGEDDCKKCNPHIKIHSALLDSEKNLNQNSIRKVLMYLSEKQVIKVKGEE